MARLGPQAATPFGISIDTALYSQGYDRLDKLMIQDDVILRSDMEPELKQRLSRCMGMLKKTDLCSKKLKPGPLNTTFYHENYHTGTNLTLGMLKPMTCILSIYTEVLCTGI